MELINSIIAPVFAIDGTLIFRILLSLVALFTTVFLIALIATMIIFFHSYYTGKGLPKVMAKLLQ